MRVAVALPIPLPPLSYEFPGTLGVEPYIGMPVEVPLRKRKVSGYIVALEPNERATKYETKDVLRVLSDWPSLPAEYLDFLHWAADYYHYSLGEVIEAALPPKMTLKKDPQFLSHGIFQQNLSRHTLSPKQGAIAQELRNALDAQKFSGFLLQGVTGSGKTEVYLSAAEHALQSGGSVLILVPEISLTPQLFARVRHRLGDKIAILHSGLTDKARSDQWHLLFRGDARVAVGARSTIFAPAKNLRLIIIDEEHEGAFKQEDRFRYHARDLALLRAKQNNAVVILGSATPSLETLHNVKVGKLKSLELPDRITGSVLPAVEILDLRLQKNERSISNRLKRLIEETLADKKQVMLFLNRRGHASCILCKSCGHVPECPNCSVSLTHYRQGAQLRCHYCAYEEAVYSACKECASKELQPGTLGTESLEAEAKELFPNARVLRMDAESLTKKNEMESALQSIEEGLVDIVVGTQMIAKGHDFSSVHLVAIIHADSTMNFPDFRASERSFQLFTQMAGRAGRSQNRGKVVIQTYNPDHPAIIHSSKHDYRSFAAQELAERETFHYPPYYRLVRILVSDASSSKARLTAEQIAEHILSRKLAGLEVLGPAPALLHKLKNKHRWNLLLKCHEASLLHRLLKSDLSVWRESSAKSTLLQVDVDPVSLV